MRSSIMGCGLRRVIIVAGKQYLNISGIMHAPLLGLRMPGPATMPPWRALGRVPMPCAQSRNWEYRSVMCSDMKAKP